MSLVPYNRHELFLAAMSDNSITLPDYPLTREERYLAKIAGEDVTIPDAPYNRYEVYLAKLCGEDVTVPTPVSRLEMFMYAACGENIEPPSPVSREEMFWADYVEASGGTTIASTDVASFDDGADDVAFKRLVVDVGPSLTGRTSATLYHIQDLFTIDPPTYTTKKNLDDSGKETSSQYYKISSFVSIQDDIEKVNFRYYFGRDSSTNTPTKLAGYSSASENDFISPMIYSGNDKNAGQKSKTNNDVPSGTKYVRVGIWNSGTKNITLCDSSTDKTQTISWSSAAGTIYGGKLDVMAGTLTVTHEYTASYDGTMDDYLKAHKWISSADTYAEGTAPSVGASVVYELEEADWTVVDNLSITEPRTYEGVNKLWANTGNITLTYKPAS